MTWNIPWKYRVKTGSGTAAAYVIQDVDIKQYIVLENSGRTVITKDHLDGDDAAKAAKTPGGNHE